MNLEKNKVIVLGSIAFDYIMGFDENFVNAVSIDHEKGDSAGGTRPSRAETGIADSTGIG